MKQYPAAFGMIIGLGLGLVAAVLFGTDSGLSAASGYASGAVVGSFFRPEFPIWARMASVVALVAVLTFAWWA